MISASRVTVAFTLLLIVPLCGRADPDINDTKFLTQPAVSANHVAFIYADDLWLADIDGRNVRRLTSDIGMESRPVFAPDGRSIAFRNVENNNFPIWGSYGKLS